jgi:hypothetical protein
MQDRRQLPALMDDRLPEPIETLLIAERRRENLMLADVLRRRAECSPREALAQQARSMLVGFATGSAIVIPVLIAFVAMPGLMPQIVPRPQQAVMTPAKPPAPTLVSVPRPAERPTYHLPSASEPDRVLAQKLDVAQSRMARREVLAAREVLVGQDIASQPEAIFALAETYDPNVLASLNVTHVGADSERARSLYGQALAGGIEAARQRLGGLQ